APRCLLPSVAYAIAVFLADQGAGDGHVPRGVALQAGLADERGAPGPAPVQHAERGRAPPAQGAQGAVADQPAPPVARAAGEALGQAVGKWAIAAHARGTPEVKRSSSFQRSSTACTLHVHRAGSRLSARLRTISWSPARMSRRAGRSVSSPRS